MKEIGVYVHIPFCKSKCYYCDFCSFPSDKEHKKIYVNALVKEIENWNFVDEFSLSKNQCIVKTFYIGGGTPSIIDGIYIEQIVNKIKEQFFVDENAEITIEVNPGTADREKLVKYKSIGINRLSIGLQSTDNKMLKSIGRIHTYEQFECVYNIAREVGFSNINVDLMIGLPGQTTHDVNSSLNELVKKNPEHISVYSLILEDDTKLKELVESRALELPSEDKERKMYWLVKSFLENNGFKHYEISNFSKPGYESKHNSDCWNQKEYIGFGLGAHSYVEGKRLSNTSNFVEYIDNINNGRFEKNKEIHEIQDKSSKMNEYVILRLRMLDGLNFAEFKEKFEKNFMEKYKSQYTKLEKQGLIYTQNECLRLTDKGINFANIVWAEFLDFDDE